MRFEARVVVIKLRNTDVERFQVSASEQLIQTYRTSGEFSFAIKRCTNRDRGGGTIYGTYMPEKICGRRGADQIHPGQGNDAVDAGAGNDVIFARDRTFDRISCGPGRDTVVADRVDQVARDCELVKRR
jgi:Ca2+-binding RTX toxin-like protein